MHSLFLRMYQIVAFTISMRFLLSLMMRNDGVFFTCINISLGLIFEIREKL